jgi:hypothetical protein
VYELLLAKTLPRECQGSSLGPILSSPEGVHILLHSIAEPRRHFHERHVIAQHGIKRIAERDFIFCGWARAYFVPEREHLIEDMSSRAVTNWTKNPFSCVRYPSWRVHRPERLEDIPTQMRIGLNSRCMATKTSVPSSARVA